MAMSKTTLYLPDQLKTELMLLAAETGRSEADLIREGIRLMLAQHPSPAPQSAIFESGQPDISERVDELLQGFGQE